MGVKWCLFELLLLAKKNGKKLYDEICEVT